jgi:TfoX/Sxy family transcriptional regulator of competence genes
MQKEGGLEMPFDETLAGIMRDELSRLEGVTEKKMFGGLCFMLNGNMLCGIDKKGGMARVGKENEATALEMEGIDPLSFTGRKMGGMVDIDAAVFDDDQRLRAIVGLAIDFVGALPAK